MLKKQRDYLFTMIELLITIALISILAAMLLPGLKKARESANCIKCKSNLRQMLLGYNNYAQDYDSWVPHYKVDNSWFLAIGYTSKDYGKLGYCPTQKPFPPLYNSGVPISYGMNYVYWGSIHATLGWNVKKKIGDANNSKCFIVSDSCLDPATEQPRVDLVIRGSSSSYYPVSYRHSGRTNMGFLDGHCYSEQSSILESSSDLWGY